MNKRNFKFELNFTRISILFKFLIHWKRYENNKCYFQSVAHLTVLQHFNCFT